MRSEWLFKELEKGIHQENRFAYASLIEESLKIASYARGLSKPLLVVKENSYLASRLSERLACLFDDGEVIAYLPEESLRAEVIAVSYENRAERLYGLYAILKKKVKIIVVTPYGLMRYLPSPDIMSSFIRDIKVNDIVEREDLIKYLLASGYEKVLNVEHPLSFAIRGSVLDVFSINYSRPIRIEFFDDEVDSIRFFDADSQSTVEKAKEIELCFAKDIFFNDKEKEKLREIIINPSGSIEMDLDYIDNNLFTPKLYFYMSFFKQSNLVAYLDNPAIYISNEEEIEKHIAFLEEESSSFIEEMMSEDELPRLDKLFGDYNSAIKDLDKVYGAPFKELVPSIEEVDLPYNSLKELVHIIKRKASGMTIIALSGKEKEELEAVLKEEEIDYQLFNNITGDGLYIWNNNLREGFSIRGDITIYTQNELFAKRKASGRFMMKYQEASPLNSYDELKKGDYVVHSQYGIGQYLGIEQKEVNHIRLDYLKIVYAGNDVLLVPLSQFSLVRKYVSKEGFTPRLHKLGSKQWAKTREKVEKDVGELAKRLVELYSLREKRTGYAFDKDSPMQKEFEDHFFYDLTKDQERAIIEVKKDMESDVPMDRLLCGDVGFGKTEVALRAAFKAVLSGKQVAYLCPTTILSLQHYKTFLNRLLEYPVNVAVINRYNTVAEQREIIKGLKDGSIDIIIGTHRLLSKDISFNDLGLLIIDEEQRFGVEHKEKIKELKTSVDVLSLSATPIPRTLQMSLIGIYGLSTLDVPPQNRYPVQTYVVEKNQGLIKEVINRELDRGGQVFYLFNDVDKIYSVAKKIEEMVPYANVAVAHGKMDKEEIEDVMFKFYQGDTNVLICTTIIETGIDIPNANTILVENAHNFGLSQLYQIKGRVGRSDRIAYAYLLVPPKKELSEKSRKRLDAIKEFTALGSGYKIAMRDLSIRGAGDLLGDKQSGFIDNVGLDLYLSMLQKAIEDEKNGEAKKEEKQIINVPISSYIPEDFSYNDYDKLTVYHRLNNIHNRKELLKYEKELNDHYGHLPKEVVALFDKKRIELLIEKNEIDDVKAMQNRFMIVLSEECSNRIDGYKLFSYCNKLSKDIKISYAQQKLTLITDNRKENVYKLISLSEKLKDLEKGNAH